MSCSHILYRWSGVQQAVQALFVHRWEVPPNHGLDPPRLSRLKLGSSIAVVLQ
jgi:hypothetical protein